MLSLLVLLHETYITNLVVNTIEGLEDDDDEGVDDEEDEDDDDEPGLDYLDKEEMSVSVLVNGEREMGEGVI